MSEPTEVTIELLAAYALVDEMVAKADGELHKGPAWCGWALRDAYLAGVKAERERCLAICHKVGSWPSDDESQQIESLIQGGQ